MIFLAKTVETEFLKNFFEIVIETKEYVISFHKRRYCYSGDCATRCSR